MLTFIYNQKKTKKNTGTTTAVALSQGVRGKVCVSNDRLLGLKGFDLLTQRAKHFYYLRRFYLFIFKCLLLCASICALIHQNQWRSANS